MLESSDDSGRSATAAETEIEQLRSQLVLARARSDEAEARLDAVRVDATHPLDIARTMHAAKQTELQTDNRSSINLALDPPVPSPHSGTGYLNMTPKDLFKYVQNTPNTPMPQTPAPSRGGVTKRRSSCDSIEEERDASAGGANAKKEKFSSSFTASELMARSIVAAEAEKRKLKEFIAKDKGKLKVLRILARLCLSFSVRVYDIAVLCAEYAADLSIQQLVSATLLVYVFGNKVKPLIKYVIMRVSNKLLELGTGHMHSLLLSARSSLTAFSAAIVARLVAITLKQPVLSVSPSPTPIESNDDSNLLMVMSDFRISKAVLMTAHELEVTDGLKAALMDNGASSNTSCSKSLDGAIPGTFKAEDAGEIGLGSDGASLTSNGSHLYALKRFGHNGSELVVRRLKHTPSLPMPYVFSEATENKKHGYGIYWAPGKRRVIKSPSGQEIELFHSESDLGWLKVAIITNQDTILSMLKMQKTRGGNKLPANNLTVLSPKVDTAGGDVFGPKGSLRETSGDAVEDSSHAGARSQTGGGTPVGEAEMNPADNMTHLRTKMGNGVPSKLPLTQEPFDKHIDPEPVLVPRFCSMCGTEGELCMEPHCMRGPCCQPNESCARCHTPSDMGMLNNMMVPPPPPPLPRKSMPKYISRLFNEPPTHVGSDLMPKCNSVDDAAKYIAHFLVSMERAGTRHTQSNDETSACNWEPRVEELVQQMAVFLGGKSFSTFGPILVLEALKADAIKCGHTVSNMLEMRLDKRHPGRCNECRVEFERESIHPCLVCSQMLCDSCLPDGCHNWCITPSAWAMPLRTLNAIEGRVSSR